MLRLVMCLAPCVQLSAGCSMHVVEGKACTNAARVKIIGRPAANSSDECCAACAAMPTCGAWTFHADSRGGSCLVADRASAPGQIHGATCGSKGPLPPPLNPPAPPHPPHAPLPPLPKPPPGLQVASLQLEFQLIMSDSTGFLRDPSSPIQAPDGVWHAWAVWVDPKYLHFHSICTAPLSLCLCGVYALYTCCSEQIRPRGLEWQTEAFLLFHPCQQVDQWRVCHESQRGSARVRSHWAKLAGCSVRRGSEVVVSVLHRGHARGHHWLPTKAWRQSDGQLVSARRCRV